VVAERNQPDRHECTRAAADIRDGQPGGQLESRQLDRQMGVSGAARPLPIVPAVQVDDEVDGVHLTKPYPRSPARPDRAALPCALPQPLFHCIEEFPCDIAP
jgi:hypothetical protein